MLYNYFSKVVSLQFPLNKRSLPDTYKDRTRFFLARRIPIEKKPYRHFHRVILDIHLFHTTFARKSVERSIVEIYSYTRSNHTYRKLNWFNRNMEELSLLIIICSAYNDSSSIQAQWQVNEDQFREKTYHHRKGGAIPSGWATVFQHPTWIDIPYCLFLEKK